MSYYFCFHVPLSQAAENLRTMIEMARKRGISVILIAVPEPAVFLSPPDLYRELAEASNIPLEDRVLSNVLADSALKSDRIHPNGKGCRIIAESLYQLMKNAGAL